MKTIPFPLILLFGVLFTFSDARSQNWPMANGCIQRTSLAPDCSNLSLPFSMDVVAQTTASEMSYYDGVLYLNIAGSQNELHAIDVQSGNLLWSFAIPNSAGSASVIPAISDSIVLTGGQNGAGLYALNRFSGSLLWMKPIGNLYTRNPMIGENRVYIVLDSLYCINIPDGSTIWSQALGGQFTPALDESKVYVFGNGYLNAFNKNTGNLVWQTTSSYYAIGQVAVGHQFVFADKGTSVSAYDKTSGIEMWNYPLPAGLMSGVNQGPMAVSDNVICLAVWDNGQGSGQITAINSSDGSYLWHYPMASEGTFSPLIANGMVFIVNWVTAGLYGFDLNSGNLIFSDNSEAYKNQPIVGDETMFVISAANIVRFYPTAIGTDEGMADTETAVRLLPAPNPCSTKATFSFEIRQRSMVCLDIFDLSGNKIRAGTESVHDPGRCNIEYNIAGLSAGTYIYRIKANGKEYAGKMIKR